MNQLGQDQPFFGINSQLNGGSDANIGGGGGSIVSPSLRYFNGIGTPTGWSPRFNMFGTPFGQSPTNGLYYSFSPFSQTPTGIPQPQQLISTPSSSSATAINSQQQFKVPFQPSGRPDGTDKLGAAPAFPSSMPSSSAAVGLQHLKSEPIEEMPQTTGIFFPQFPRDQHSFGMNESLGVNSMIPLDQSASSRSSSVLQARQQRGGKSGRGRRGGHRSAASPVMPTGITLSPGINASPSGSSSSTSPVSPSGAVHKRQARRPPPLNVSPRSSDLSTTDVPMTAFRLIVGAQKLCKFRRYSVTLTIPKSWRLDMGLSQDKVLKALLDAKCCRSGTSVIAGCPRCKCQPVVSLVATTKWPQDREFDEVYSCSIRTRCSSSRDHLKSSLTLVIDGLPLSQYVVSNSFVLLARDKTQAPKRFRSFDFDRDNMDEDDDDDDDDDDEDNGDKGRKSGERDGELPRKSPHKAGAATKRRQRRGSETKNGFKLSSSDNNDFIQSKAKSNPLGLLASDQTSFPPVVGSSISSSASAAASATTSSTTFPPTGLRQNSVTSASNSGESNVSSSSSNSNSEGTNSERMYMENGQGSTIGYSGNGKNPSPIQPSSVSLPSSSPCSTPTGLIFEPMNINTYDASQTEQNGWLSPMISGVPEQQ